MPVKPRPRAKQASNDFIRHASPKDTLPSTVKSEHTPPLTNAAENRVKGSDDDDDAFFTRRRRQNGPVLGRGTTTLGITEDLLSGDSEDDDDQQAGAGNSSDYSDGEKRRRKKRRNNLSSWTKTASFSKGEGSRQPSSSCDAEGPEKERRKPSRSPSLTPPPELEKDGE
jgi:hypothetical protein